MCVVCIFTNGTDALTYLKYTELEISKKCYK